MKQYKPIYPALVTLLLLMAAGCYKDKGNYNYQDVNRITVTVTGVAGGLPITVKPLDTLRMKPTITQTMGVNENELAYEWMIFDNTETSEYTLPQVILSTNRNLEIRIAEPNFSLGQSYRLSCKVTDKHTGISAFFFCNISVENRFARGWMFLEDKPNGGDYSMMLPDSSLVRDVFALHNPGVPMGNGKPVKIDVTILQVDDAITKASKKLYIQNENSGIEVNFQTMVKKFDMGNLFFNAPATMKPVKTHWYGLPTLGICVNDQQVHVCEVGGFPGIKKFTAALAAPAGGYDYKAAGFIANGTAYPFIWDSKGKRFMIVRASKLDSFPTNASTKANMNNMGMDLLSLDPNNITNSYNAILKNSSNAIYLLKILFSGATASLTDTFYQVNAPNIANATAIGSIRTSPHVFYAVNNTLYRFETTSGATTQPFSFPPGETVQLLRFWPNDNTMAAATWNGTEGKVYLFEMNALGNMVNNTYKKMYGGFARVVDMAFKF